MNSNYSNPSRGNRCSMLREHPLTKLILTEGSFPEVIVVTALRRPATDIVVQIRWRMGTALAPSARKVDGVTVQSICPGRLPEQLLRWKFPWGHVSELEELVEQAAWSLGGSYLERFSKAPSDPASGLGPQFCGLGKYYSFPGQGATSIGQTRNEDLMEEAARTGYWVWRFNTCYRQGQSPHPVDRGNFLSWRKKEPTLQEDGSRMGPFPGWLPREPFCGRSGEWWLKTAKELETDNVQSLYIAYNFTRRCIQYENYNK